MTNPPYFAGYASVFDVVDRDRDVVVPGAFRRTLRSGKAFALLWQHRQDEPIGVVRDLREDARGLWIAAELTPEVARAQEAYALLKAGALSGLSIGYVARDWTVDPRTGNRLLTEVELWEISLVTFPANPQATVTQVKAARGILPATGDALSL